MTERRGSGRNIRFWHATCQRPGCGHPRVRHLTTPKVMCTAVVITYRDDGMGSTASPIGRCDCEGFQEVKE